MITLELQDGIAVDGEKQTQVTLEKPMAGDILDATSESEKLTVTPSGYQLIVSDSLVAIHILRRQIKNIGTIKGPIELSIMRKLSAADLEKLNQCATQIDSAMTAQALDMRGK